MGSMIADAMTISVSVKGAAAVAARARQVLRKGFS
jgi:hypothetical protein